MSTYNYDLFVIGGGSGGVRAARIAAQHGARVALAEEYRYGGTCVIRGCVPKKLFVYASRFNDDFEDSAGFGWSVTRPVFDWSKLVSMKNQEITRLENIYHRVLKKAGVESFNSRAVLVDAHTVLLTNNGRSITADKILIATGGTTNKDSNLPGIEHVICSNEAFDLKNLPKRIIVVGGGYIAVEFAGIFAGLGSETTLVCRGNKILRGFDDDISQILTDAYQKRGIRIINNNILTSVEKTKHGVRSTISSGEILEADQIMLAIGRSPNTNNLGLKKAGVELGSKGEIKVNSQSQTNIHNIYAVGDVTNRLNLTPVAIREGHLFADNVFGYLPSSFDYETIPTAVFSTPEIGTVGMPEHIARKTFTNIDVYKSCFRPMKATISGREEHMLMKLLVNTSDQRIIGCHIVGDASSEIVQMAAISIQMGAKKIDFDNTMALHPSASEELVTMREKL
ncbi:MAG: glutathione-disulfide reductase [Hyphomicrobiaceae bacterium]|nr:glutathione-disulfide reductase [Hyphomicrobiaceae bacterium]